MPTGRPVVWGLAASVLMLVIGAAIWHGRTRPAPPFGRFSAEQIIARMLPLCAAAAPGYRGCYLQAEPRVATDTLGRDSSLWVVDAVDPAGRELSHWVWDADTGELMWMSRDEVDAVCTGHRPLSAAAAALCARRWLEAVAPSNGDPWGPAWAPRRSRLSGRAWSVRFRSARRTALVMLDDWSGQMTGISIKRTRSARADAVPSRWQRP